MRASILLTFVVAAADGAAAYPWMINHGYAMCSACHVDPNGGGQLTEYGRAQADLIVRWHLDPKDLEAGEPSPTSGLLWGLVAQPEWLNVSGNVRAGGMARGTVQAPQDTGLFPLLMAADVAVTVNVAPVVAHAVVGYGIRAQTPLVGPAVALAPGDGDHAVMSREHWLGVKFLDDSLVVRAGRIPVPFGLRNNEHFAWVRSATRTDINVSQQHGVAVSFANEVLRTEVMGLLGNYQIRPDDYRERGYAGFFEYAPVPNLAVAASSKLTWANLDLERQRPALRHQHGMFARWAPLYSADGGGEWLTLMAEADALVAHIDDDTEVGGVGWLQVDLQPMSGVHVMPSLEALATGAGNEALPSMGAWLSFAWYPLPHTELRLDNLYRHATPKTGDAVGEFASLLQLHVFL